MVLILVIDHVGAPLHRHHHDSGVDAAHLSESDSTHHNGLDDVAHAEEHANHDEFAHATLVMRQTGASQLTVVPAADVESQVNWIFLTSVLALLALAFLREESLIRPFGRWLAPPKPTYRSLPPAGRAPPLHA